MCVNGACGGKTGKFFCKTHRWRKTMPYIIGWFLGVPVIVLVILYMIFS